MARIRKQQEKADAGRVLVDKQLESLEGDISRLYANASKEMRDKSEAFLDDYWQKDKKMRARQEAGEITEDQLKSWRKGQAYQMEKMSAQVADLTQTMLNADKTAMAMVGDKLPDVYATSYNYAGYRGEKYAQATGRDYTSFTIYNRDAVRKLAKDDPDLLPAPRVDIPKDERWNRQHIQNAIAQGIIQGEPVSDISSRLMAVTTMDENAALRNARTAVNGIENKARFDATEQLKADGVPMVYTWSATHDGRTRESHILLDGQHPDEDGYFENGLRYPADPDGEPAEVYNCRCALLTQIEGIDHSKDDELYDQFMQEQDYDSWLALKENENQQAKEQAFQQHKAEALAKRAEADQLQQTQDNMDSIDIPAKPERPSKNDYNTDEEYQEAKEKYKQEREEYEEAKDRFIQEVSNSPSMSAEEFRSWCDDKDIRLIEGGTYDPKYKGAMSDVTEIDGRLLQKLTDRYDELFDKFPDVLEYREKQRQWFIDNGYATEGEIDKNLTKFSIGYNKNELFVAEASYGFTFGNDSGGTIEGMADAYFDQVSRGYLCKGKGSVETIFDHEFGHNVKYTIEYKITEKGGSRTEFGREVVSRLSNKEGHSQYSTTNEDEMFAEAFSAYIGGEKTPFANEMGKILKEHGMI